MFWLAFGLAFAITLLVLLLMVEFGAPIPKSWDDVDWNPDADPEDEDKAGKGGSV